jgi:hypothetical protein
MNADGSVDIYIGPKALFDKSWKMDAHAAMPWSWRNRSAFFCWFNQPCSQSMARHSFATDYPQRNANKLHRP